MNPAAIPELLRDRDQWLLFDRSADTPRRPHWDGDFSISWSDPDEWHSFGEAKAKADQVESWGVGYVCAAKNDKYPMGVISVIDIDGGATPDDSPKDWLPSLEPFGDRAAYVEWSASHDEPGDSGIHIPIAGTPPEWWRDIQLAPDVHEGVDVLSNKFCAFTGDVMTGISGSDIPRWDDWTDEWLMDAYEALEGETPPPRRNGRVNDYGGDSGDSSGSYDRQEEWVDEEVAEEALSHISPNCTYEKWRNIGFALSDHFASSTAERLFENWSRGGSKFDRDAERYIKDIANRGSGGITIGTLVHHAKEAGWEPDFGSDSYEGTPTARELVARYSDEYDSVDDVPEDIFDRGHNAEEEEKYGGSSTYFGDPDAHEPETAPKSDGGVESDGGMAARTTTLNPYSVVEKAAADPLNQVRFDDEGNIEPGPQSIRVNERAHYVWELAKETGDDGVLAQEHGPIYAYDDGVWRDDDGVRLRQIAKQGLDSLFSAGAVSELEEQVRTERTKPIDELGAPDETIACQNGLLHLREREIEALKREHYALAKIDAPFDPSADCARFESFIKQAIPDDDDRDRFQEYAGYVLWRHAQPFGKAMFFVGPTDSGKGTALKAIRAVVGGDNIANESLYDLIQTRWGTAQLFGKVANIRNEVTPSGLDNIQKFKELTGGEDEVSAEFKGQDKFEMVVTQKFLFSTNEIPTVDHADEAFYNRLLFVEFPHSVPPEQQDPQLLDKLAEEKSGILNWMLDGLERLLNQGGFTAERSITAKKEMCDAFGGVIDRFTHNCVIITGDSEDCVKKSDLYDLAHAYADDLDKSPEWDTQTGFTREFANQRGVSQGQKHIDGHNHKVFRGVRVKPEFVYRYSMEDKITAVAASDDTGRNTGLSSYGDEMRPGFDSTKDTEHSPIHDNDDSLENESLGPHIVHFVRENHKPDGVDRGELFEHLRNRGASESSAEHWIQKCLRRGNIYDPNGDGTFFPE